jgi:hypothetical protein
MRHETAEAERQCRSCRHFRNDAKYLEAAFPGLTSLSSGYGSTRADDGLCLQHDRYLSARSSCPDFAAKTLSRAKSSDQTRCEAITEKGGR